MSNRFFLEIRDLLLMSNVTLKQSRFVPFPLIQATFNGIIDGDLLSMVRTFFSSDDLKF